MWQRVEAGVAPRIRFVCGFVERVTPAQRGEMSCITFQHVALCLRRRRVTEVVSEILYCAGVAATDCAHDDGRRLPRLIRCRLASRLDCRCGQAKESCSKIPSIRYTVVKKDQSSFHVNFLYKVLGAHYATFCPNVTRFNHPSSVDYTSSTLKDDPTSSPFRNFMLRIFSRAWCSGKHSVQRFIRSSYGAMAAMMAAAEYQNLNSA